ncbi:MAG: winged helix-turn-helix transcriptional regulator [bacterium]|nr:winged helix-turn-helix transcriptional regulator [bacterium]
MTIDEIAELHGLLADTTRLRILNLLRGGPLCACHVIAALGLPQSTVSRHLGWLKVGGLIELNQAERYSIYSTMSDCPFADVVNTAARRAADIDIGKEDLARLRDALRELPNKYVSRTE